jgi:hypothetical protein
MANSIINSDDGVVSGTSGIKTTGGDTGGLEIQSNGAVVFDTLPTQVAARQTFYAIDAGVPVIARSTDSNTYKYGMEDTSGGTQRGFIGANSTNALMVANGSATNVMNVTSAGVLQMNSGYGSVANAFGVRAWANFTGGNPPAQVSSGGLSSVAYGGATGVFTINFASAMPDTGYSVVTASYYSAGNNPYHSAIQTGTKTTANFTLVSIQFSSPGPIFFNVADTSFAVVR